jgi:WD40 repeat protein
VAVNATRIALAWGGDAVRLVPVDGGPPIELQVPGETLNKIAVDPEGRYAAAASTAQSVIHVWDLETGESFSLDAGDGIGIANMRMVAGGRLVVSHSEEERSSHGLSLWDIEKRRHERHFEGSEIRWFGCSSGADDRLAASEDGRFVLGVQAKGEASGQRPMYLADLEDRSLHTLDAFTARADLHMGLDTSGSTVVAWSQLRHFEIARVTAKHPHIVPWPVGPEQVLGLPSFSPQADRFAVGYGDGSIWLHSVPDLDSPPLNFSSPLDEFIARLETFTNLRAVRDPESETGWKFEVGPFPGWEKEPEW